MKIIILLLFTSISIFAKSINIAVAANVSYAMPELKKEFNKIYPDIKLRYTLGSSGKLTAQITNGAPYDILISANMKYPNNLYKNQLAITKPVIYARGALVYLSRKKLNLSKGAKLLEESSIKKIAIANPKTAPYGIAAYEVLKNANILEKVKSKLVYAESISQTVAYTLKATDIGFVAKSTLFSPKMTRFKKGINWLEVDKNLYTPIDQGIVVLKKAKGKNEAKSFYDFMLGEKAKEILKKYGYIL